MKKVMLSVLALSLYTLSASADLRPARSGNVSFGGIQVKVSVDESKGLFQIGESQFSSEIFQTSAGRLMTAAKTVGINLSNEILTATVFLDGGNGGDPYEYNCADLRIKITRLATDGKVTVLKNECAFLDLL